MKKRWPIVRRWTVQATDEGRRTITTAELQEARICCLLGSAGLGKTYEIYELSAVERSSGRQVRVERLAALAGNSREIDMWQRARRQLARRLGEIELRDLGLALLPHLDAALERRVVLRARADRRERGVSPRGGLVICEDSDQPVQRLYGMTREGGLFEFCRNNVLLGGERGFAGDYRDAEWAGACFSPDGRWLAFTRFARAGRLNRVMLQRLGPGFALDGAAAEADASRALVPQLGADGFPRKDRGGKAGLDARQAGGVVSQPLAQDGMACHPECAQPMQDRPLEPGLARHLRIGVQGVQVAGQAIDQRRLRQGRSTPNWAPCRRCCHSPGRFWPTIECRPVRLRALPLWRPPKPRA